MATQFKLRRSAVASKVPTTAQLELGELALNTNDGRLYFKKDDGAESIVTLREITEDSLVIDTSTFSNTVNATETLADILYTLDQAVSAGGITEVTSSDQFTGAGTLADPLTLATLDYVDLDSALLTKPTHSEGRIFYDNEYGALAVYNSKSDITLQVGQEEWVMVYNNTGSTITNGTPVYITGASGETPTVAPGNAQSYDTAELLGVATHDIPDANTGYVTVRGLISGIDTSAFIAGDPVHLGVSGGIQLASPSYPYWPVEIGHCIVSDATDGYIYVNIENYGMESLRVERNAHFDGNVTVDGNLIINGTQSIASSNNISINNSYFYLNSGDTIGSANTSFSGTGLDDAYFTGHFEGTETKSYYVRIDGEGTGTGGVDTFEWSYDNFTTTEATGVDLADQVILGENICIHFNAFTGHTTGDTWSGSVSPVNVDTGWMSNRNTGTSGVGYTHMGVFFDVTDEKFKVFDAYAPEIEGNIDTSDTSFNLGTLVANTFEGNLTGTADYADRLTTARTISLGGDLSGSALFNGTSDITITAIIADDSHDHTISNIDGLQLALNAKADETITISAGTGLTGGGDLTANRSLGLATTGVTAGTYGSGTAIPSIQVDNYGRIVSISTNSVQGYAGWTLYAGGLDKGTIAENEIVDFAAGDGVTLTYSTTNTNQIKFSHTDTSSVTDITAANRTYVKSLTFDTFGHVTGYTTGTETVVDTNNYLTGLSFSGGTLTASRQGLTDVSVNLDGRYLQSFTETDTLHSVTTRGNSTTNSITVNNATINGNLTVNGTTTTVNSTTTTLDDPVITLGGDTAPTVDDNKDRGVEFRYYNSGAKLGFMGWDDSAQNFTLLHTATNTNEVFSGTVATLNAKVDWSNLLNKPTYDNYGSWTAEDGDGTQYAVTSGDVLKFASGGAIVSNFTADDVLTISHADTSSQASVDNSNGTIIQDITLDTYGHITGIGSLDGDARWVNKTGDTMSGDLTIANSTPVLYLNDTDNGSGGGYTGYISFNSTGGESFRIGDWAAVNETGGPDILRIQNTNGTRIDVQFGSAGTTAGSLYVAGNKVFNDGYHPNADKWTTARTLSLTGDVTGSVSWDGSANASMTTTVADDSHNHRWLYGDDNRTISPSEDSSYRMHFGFTSWANNNTAPYADYLHLRSYSDSSGGSDNLVMFKKDGIGMRIWQQTYGSATAYSSYVDMIHSGNYSSYALPLSGGTVTGNLTVNGDILVDEIRARTNQDLTITAGESYTIITDGTYNDEIIRIGSENGVIVYSSTDNLTSGLNKSVTLIDSAGDMKIHNGGLKIGSEVVLRESTDRADLLEITSSTSGWGGIQIRNSSNEGRWSFMTDGEAAGIYNDEDNTWQLYMHEDGRNAFGSSTITAGYRLDIHGSTHQHNGDINYVNQLHFNDNVRFYDNGDDSYLNYKFGDTATGAIRFQNGSGTQCGLIYSDSTAANFGLLNRDGQWALRSTATTTHLYYDGADKLQTRTDGVNVTGTLFATDKSFLIDHPTKEGYKLRHGVVEGPENSVYVRGQLKGTNVIELPDYWTGLVHEDTITVQLTSNGAFQKLFVKEIKDNTVIVGNSSWFSNKTDCFYYVQATRKDIEQFEVEYEAK